MLGEVVLAPAVPLVGLMGITFVLFAAALLMWGVIFVFDYTLGLLMDAMAGLVKGVPFVGGIAKGAIEGAKHNIRQRMVGAAVGMETTAGKFWHGIEAISRYSADSILAFGHDTEVSIRNLVHSVIPNSVYAGTAPLADRIARGYDAENRRAREQARERAATAKAQAADLDNTFGRARGGIDNVDAKAKANTDARVSNAEGRIAAERAHAERVQNGRLSWLEKVLGVGVIGGVALATLSRVFPYWQCSNFRRFARGVCRSPLGSLDWLFGLAAATIFTLNLEEVVHEGQDVANAFAYLWDEIKQQGE